MKDLSARWAVTILLAPVLLILGLALLGGPEPASAKAPPQGKATVAVAFIGSFANSPTATNFQRIGLNVISVRLNPSTDPNVSEFDGNWVSIDVPPGVGRNSGVVEISTGNSFGGNLSNSNTSVEIGTGKSEIQIELNAIQNIAEIFNAQQVRARTYNQVELVLDGATPGNVVPLCAGATSGEGCISYQAKFPVVTPTPITPMSIRTTITGGLDLSKNQNIVTPLVIRIDPGIGAGPTAFNQTVNINPTITVPTTTPPGPGLGTLLGTITTTATPGFSGVRTQAITAELAGTNNIVEKILLPKSCNGKKSCTFTMYLPALDASVGGTNYDLFASAINATYAVRSNVNVAAGQTTDITTPTTFAVANKKGLSLSGKITDACASLGVQAATLNLLMPDPLASPAPDCTLNPPTGCVVVATASSDEVGNFPLPGNGNNRAPFNIVPPPDTGGYQMVTTAAGFDRTLQTVTAKSGLLKCTTAKAGACNFAMNHGKVSGNVTLAGGAVGPLTIAVIAEDTGTNNIENLALVDIKPGASSAPFMMNVPDNGAIAGLDFFAAAQDLFNGAPQTHTGHSIAVLSGVTPPDPPTVATPPVCSTVALANNDLSGITCVGHSSVTGTVTGPSSGDTVVLSLGGVDLQTVPIIPPVAPSAGTYALCAPADSAAYTLEYLNSAGDVVATSPPFALPGPVLVPQSSPCPSICPNAVPNQNTGCLICNPGANVNF